MPGSLQVFTVQPIDFDVGQPGWEIDGSGPSGPGTYYASGFTLTPVSDGAHIISFQPEADVPNPAPVTVMITDGNLTVTAGTYNVATWETPLESGCKALVETKTLSALDTALPSSLFFAASAIDAAFSGYARTLVHGPQPGYPAGEAYIAAQAMGVVFNEGYAIMLEGGQYASDLLSEEELGAIEAIMEPYLTSSGRDLPGGIPIRVGFLLLERTVDSWTIQRGKGFSVQPAIDAGFVAGVPSGLINQSWASIGSEPGDSQYVTGFAVAWNGTTWPAQAPIGYEGEAINGMPTPVPPSGPMVQGYPAGGGANISQPTPIAGAVTINTVNSDATINASFSGRFPYAGDPSNVVPGTALGGVQQGWMTGITSQGPSVGTSNTSIEATGSEVFEGLNQAQVEGSYSSPGTASDSTTVVPPADWFNVVLGNFAQDTHWISDIPPQYYVGSPDWTWNFYGVVESGINYGAWVLTWNGTWNGNNANEFNAMNLVMIFWLGMTITQPPQVNFTGPITLQSVEAYRDSGYMTPPSSPEPFEGGLTAFNCCAPADRNARVTETTNGTVSPFAISLTNPPSASSYQLFSLQ